MSQVIATHYNKDSRIHDDFLKRFRKNLAKELVGAYKIIRITFGIIFAILLGTLLFLAEFDFTKKFFAIAFIPVVVFLIGTYLTLLPTFLVITISILSLYSLASTEPGDSLIKWSSETISSLFEGFGGATSEKTSLAQKLLGFVTLSAVASFFIVLFI